jgi:hypothetical protein
VGKIGIRGVRPGEEDIPDSRNRSRAQASDLPRYLHKGNERFPQVIVKDGHVAAQEDGSYDNDQADEKGVVFHGETPMGKVMGYTGF